MSMLLGVVHDPTARRMGGVAGHSGLFSTAADLAIFCRMLLDGGVYLAPSQFEAAFVSLAHDGRAIDRTLEAARRAFASL